MTKDDTLKPCPFCGGEAELNVELTRDVVRYTISCRACGASVQERSKYDDFCDQGDSMRAHAAPRISPLNRAADKWNARKGE